jgi:hypothetical protein
MIRQTMLDVVGILFGLLVLAGILGVLVWASRRHSRLYPKGRDRIGRDPEAAQATRRFETMWAFFSGRSGG